MPEPPVPLAPPVATWPPVPWPPVPGAPPVPLEPPPLLQPVVAINAAVAKSKIEVPVISTARLKDMFASEGKKGGARVENRSRHLTTHETPGALSTPRAASPARYLNRWTTFALLPLLARYTL
jgi:hypothetical protein